MHVTHTRPTRNTNWEELGFLLIYHYAVVLTTGDDEFFVPSLKNFEFQGEWIQYHNCGSHDSSADHTCMVCRKENAKLANFPLQPMDHCSPNCAVAFDALRQRDRRPPQVICTTYLCVCYRIECRDITGVSLQQCARFSIQRIRRSALFICNYHALLIVNVDAGGSTAASHESKTVRVQEKTIV